MLSIDKKNNIYYKYLSYNLKKHKLNKYKNYNLLELIEETINLMIDFISKNIDQFIHIDLYEPVFEYSYDILHVQYIDSNILENLYKLEKNVCENILIKCVKISQSFVFKFLLPKRSYSKTFIRKNLRNECYNLNVNYNKIKKTIQKLKSVKQPEQRTDEWYTFRNSTLTASNLWKVFNTEYQQNELIIEKCEPLDINKYKVTNTNSPMHWGQKYEPVSTLYYEYINNTKVTEFGCIPHSDYNFIGASPDGIICDSSSNLFGRMLEIKNVVSREITGIPKMEYWIQMQLQMEVCELDECDFLETKFTEYTKEEYIEDFDTKYKGTILQYLKNETPYYVYPPFMMNDIDSEEYKLWLEEQTNINKDLEFIGTIYWKLEKISCILVLRNKLWFNSVISSIEFFWNTLVEERENGKYKERNAKKRKLKLEDEKSRSDFPKPGCLINSALFEDEDKKKEPENLILSVDTEIYKD